MPKVLSDDQIEQFIEEGYTFLREGFPREYAQPVLAQVWANLPAELGIRRENRSTWQHATAAPTAGPKGPEVARLYTPRVRAAFDDLLGQDRWVERGERTGAWPFTFPGFAQGPWKPTEGWHVDGGGQRTVNGPQQGLIAIMLFSDVGPGDGGTAIRVGSHKTTARVLQAAGPAGLSNSQLIHQSAQASADLPVIEAHGRIGDLVLCHGYIVHSGSVNCGVEPRIITNNCISLREPMNLQRARRDEYSVLEWSIVRAIETTHAHG